MNATDFQLWFQANPLAAVLLLLLLSVLVFLITRYILVRGLMHLASHTSTKIDDILLKHLRPARMSWLAPLALIYLLAYLLPDFELTIRKVVLFIILLVSVLTLNALLNALNEIYESRPGFNGVSIQSYLDVLKIVIALVAIILSVSLFSGESPWVLLTGLGALTAVLLLIFQNTLLSIVASVQIAAHDLIKEGDWIEVPSYEADGDVVDISLHTIKVQNFDKTFTVIPTYKIVDVAYRNWRGMQESGGRRIQRSILVDMTSIKFCDQPMLEKLRRINLIQSILDARILALEDYRRNIDEEMDSPLDGPQITNIEVFRIYIESYLRSRSDIHHNGMPFLVRALEPKPTGLPIELYIFARKTRWEDYEAIQAEIFDHLLAAAGHFDLHVFQEPTGSDFALFAQRVAV